MTIDERLAAIRSEYKLGPNDIPPFGKQEQDIAWLLEEVTRLREALKKSADSLEFGYRAIRDYAKLKGVNADMAVVGMLLNDASEFAREALQTKETK